MPVRKLKEFLDYQGVKYVSIRHSPAFTAQEVAAVAHVPGQEMAKTVVVRLDGEMTMVVLPASYRIDFELLKHMTGARTVELADEQSFKELFGECELGAMPPFGNLYGLRVFVADSLADDEEIVFNAGNHAELVRMRYDDFDRLVEPRVLGFTSRV